MVAGRRSRAGGSASGIRADANGDSVRGSSRVRQNGRTKATKSGYVTQQDADAINEMRERYQENLPCKLSDNVRSDF
eukprot:jgi/Ulvmu1/8244/UM041_0055.1